VSRRTSITAGCVFALAALIAEAAGLKKGDVIVAVDGKPANADLRALLRDRPAGSTVELTVRSGIETRKGVLMLRDQI
jgi:S1-C subfamily serine protease